MKGFHIQRFLLVIVSVLVACASDREQQRAEASFYRQLGISNLVTQSCTEALRYLLEAEKRDPDDADLQNALGLAYYCKGEFNLAINAYQKAVRLKPDFSEAYNNLGAAYAKIGQYDNANAAFDHALKNLLYATPERAYLNKGDAFYARLNYDEAARNYQKAIDLSLRKPEARDVLCVAYTRLGVTYNKQKRYRDALRSLGNAVRLCPKYPEPYGQLYNTYMYLRKQDEAMKACQKVVELAPDSRDAQSCQPVIEYIKKAR